jgi:subtilisin family serine protease
VNSPTSIAKGVVSVGAAEPRSGGLAVSEFSNMGPTLTAPGKQVLGAGQGAGLTEMSGTSIACAVAAGTAALWWEKLRREAPPGTRVTAEMVWSRMKGAVRTEGFAADVEPEARGLGLIQAPTV